MEALQAQRSVELAWRPNPGPQTDAIECQADELFYGGSAGGGKTDLLLGIAGLKHTTSIIFRRVFPNLRAIIERSREIYGRKNSYNESLHIWRLGSKLIEFGAIQYEKDKENYRGRPHDFYGWDEVAEFSETQFRFVNAWNRSVTKNQRCRVIATGNPPTTPEGEWVIKYWAPWLDPQHERPAEPGELRWFARVDDKDVEVADGKSFTHGGIEIMPRSRTFIPARLSDNPFLAESGYGSVLQALPEPLRSQLLFGDFNLKYEENPWQVIPREWVWTAQERWKDAGTPSAQMDALGVDVARGGKDRTVLTPRHGNYFAAQTVLDSSPDGQAAAGAIVSLLNGVSAQVLIDVIGIGASCYDIAKESCDAIPINFAEHSDFVDKSGKLKMVNVRAEAYWSMREALDPRSGKEITLPPDKELENELCAARWELRSNGIKIEDKEEIMARIGRSPDKADSLVIAHLKRARAAGVTHTPRQDVLLKRRIL